MADRSFATGKLPCNVPFGGDCVIAGCLPDQRKCVASESESITQAAGESAVASQNAAGMESSREGERPSRTLSAGESPYSILNEAIDGALAVLDEQDGLAAELREAQKQAEAALARSSAALIVPGDLVSDMDEYVAEALRLSSDACGRPKKNLLPAWQRLKRWLKATSVYGRTPSAMRAICPENMQPCKEGCVDGWCQTMFGHPNG